MTTHTCIIKPNLRDRDFVIIDIHRSMNSVMKDFAPARLSVQDHGWLCPTEHVDAFLRFAQHNSWAVTDQRDSKRGGSVSTDDRVQPHECRHCGQAGKRFESPRFCPGCGARWEGVEPHTVVRIDPASQPACTKCGRLQSGHHQFCTTCGGEVAYPRPKPTPLAVAKHEHLDDPQGLGDALAGVMAEVARHEVLDERIFTKADWAEFRVFWGTVPRDYLGVRPQIEAWDSAGRPAKFEADTWHA